MKLQSYEEKSKKIKEQFLKIKREKPDKFETKLNLSWSIWMFGIESLENSLRRVNDAGLRYVELKGDHYTEDTGTDPDKINRLLHSLEMEVSGVIGLFSPSNDLSSPDPYIKQKAIDYVRNQVKFTKETGGRYFIVVPSAVGRPNPADNSELLRSSAALRKCGDDFREYGIKAAIEPIRSAEVSLIHTVKDVNDYIQKVDHPAIKHINGDIYHMLCEETHIGEAIIECGDKLVNLHLADSNRDAIGKGMIDIDTVIMSAYLVGMNEENRFLTFEPLGPYPDPYVLSNEPCKVELMNELVRTSVSYFKEREEIVRNL
ncbi:MAG: sugar phosphate isomerase/epimerase [Kosmotoga sp.]|nr:MAG: sugar phosphate isomerase/epimerase [Kosmotoga sp.]